MTAVFRLGVEYEIELSGFSISPGLFFDSERDEGASIVYGIGVGYGF